MDPPAPERSPERAQPAADDEVARLRERVRELEALIPPSAENCGAAGAGELSGAGDSGPGATAPASQGELRRGRAAGLSGRALGGPSSTSIPPPESGERVAGARGDRLVGVIDGLRPFEMAEGGFGFIRRHRSSAAKARSHSVHFRHEALVDGCAFEGLAAGMEVEYTLVDNRGRPNAHDVAPTGNLVFVELVAAPTQPQEPPSLSPYATDFHPGGAMMAGGFAPSDFAPGYPGGFASAAPDAAAPSVAWTRLDALAVELLSLVDRSPDAYVLCANLPQQYYRTYGKKLDVTAYGFPKMQQLLARLAGHGVAATTGARAAICGAGDPFPDAADGGYGAADAADDGYGAASPTRLRAPGATGAATSNLPPDVRRLMGDDDGPLACDPEDLAALAVELLHLVDQSPEGYVLCANLPKQYYMTYGKKLDVAAYGYPKMAQLLARLAEHGLAATTGARATISRLDAFADAADDGSATTSTSTPPDSPGFSPGDGRSRGDSWPPPPPPLAPLADTELWRRPAVPKASDPPPPAL